MNSSTTLLQQIENSNGNIAILIDPEKTNTSSTLLPIIQKSHQVGVTFFFVGGSTVRKKDIEFVVNFIKKESEIPVILFPGSNQQFTPYADGILYLSLLSGRNPKYLIEQHIENALEVYQSNVEILPTAYLVIDGENDSSVTKVSQTKPIKRKDNKLALKTSLAGILQGKKIIYLDSGSGAKKSVPLTIIKEIKKYTKAPIIIGGGVNSTKKLISFKNLGVSIIVIGNKIENDLNFFNEINSFISNKNDIKIDIKN